MSNLRGLKFALAALVCIAALAMLLHVAAQPAAAAPLPGEIFIDADGDRTFNATAGDLGLYPTIQDAIDDASSGDVVVVGPGNYSESLTINIDISLVGANEGIDPNTGDRTNETRLIPNIASPGSLITIGSSDVVIDGFSLNGSNPALGALGVINGVNLTISWGIINFGGETNLTIVNDIMSTFDTAIMLSGTSNRSMIMFNLFDNIEPVIGGGFAVELISDFSANVTNSVFTRTDTAIFASTFVGNIGPIGSYVNIDSNFMSVTWDGIVLDRMSGPTGIFANNNVIEAIGSANAGIIAQGIENGLGASISFNAITGMQYGIMLIDNPTVASFILEGDLIIDCNYGIYAQEGAIAFVSGDSVYVVDSATIVNPASYAIYVNNTNSLGATLTRLSIQNGSIVLGGLNGAGVEGIGAVLAFNGAEPINFIGTVNFYFELINSPRDIDARQVLLDYLIGANMTVPQQSAAYVKIWDKDDNSSLGIVMIVSAQITVTKVNDLNGDGDVMGEPPIQGWTVYLWANGVQGPAQLTGADGTFTWSDLGPGVYNVSEDVPASWTATSATNFGFGSALSGASYSFTFANFQNVNITVTKLNDLTGNGQSVDDLPLPGWTVYLWTNGVQGGSELTGVDGTFIWTDLGPGSYNVTELVPAGWTATSPTGTAFGTVVSGGAYNFTFTNFQNVNVTVTKLNDLTGNGQTVDDTPIQGWTVYLWTDGVQGAPQLTGVDGTFNWTNLGPGSYMVSELVPQGWTSTSATENDFGQAVSGVPYGFTFTNFENVTIIVTKMNDLTGNGLTGDDTPIPGWTVYLWTDGTRGEAQLTDDDGTFTWADLGPGSYMVSEGMFFGWNATSPTQNDFGTVVSGGAYDFTFTNLQSVIGSPVSVTLDVGGLHFRGEIIDFWMLTTVSGLPVNVMVLSANLYTSDGFVIDLLSNVTQVSTGLYKITVEVPMDAAFGEHTLMVAVQHDPLQFGSQIRTVLISQTLTNFGAMLTSIDGNIAAIQTDIGLIKVDLSAIDARLISIQGDLATIQTDIGTIQASLGVINATLIDIQGTLATIQTDLGEIQVNLEDIGSSIESINGTLVTIQTTLGDITVQHDEIFTALEGIQGDVALINTTLGEVQVSVDAINATLIGIQGTLATIQTDLGEIQVNLEDIGSNIESINGTLVTIQTTLGNLTIQLDEIFTGIEGIQGDVALINTTLGQVQVSVEAINAVVVDIQGTLATIQTDLGTVVENVTLINAQATDITNNLVTVQTSLGMIMVNVTAIDARVTNINNTLVTVTTAIGTVQTSVTNVNAHITAVETSVARVQTTVGMITVNLTALNTTVTSIQGKVATVQTSLGTLTGNVTGVQGHIATIQTDLGTMKANISALQLRAEDNNNIGLILIVMLGMVLVILIAIYFWRLRKVI